MTDISFEYALPGGMMLEVEAKITPGRPMVQPSLAFSGEPAEAPEVEITSCFIRDPDDNLPNLPFDSEGLYLRRRDGKFKPIEDDMKDNAVEEYL